jgi:hypothetical protein
MTSLLSSNLSKKNWFVIQTQNLNNITLLRRKTMFNEKSERINGWFAMIGIVAAMGTYAFTGQIIPGIW